MKSKPILLMLVQFLLVIPICLGGEYQPDVNTLLLLHFNEVDDRLFEDLYKGRFREGSWVENGVYDYALVNGDVRGIPINRENWDFKDGFTLEFWFLPFSQSTDIVKFSFDDKFSISQNKLFTSFPLCLNKIKEGVLEEYCFNSNMRGNKILEDMQWYHIAFVYYDGCIKMFVNNVLDNEQCWDGAYSSESFEQGGKLDLANNKGVIDELRLSSIPMSNFNVDPSIINKKIDIEQIKFIEEKPITPEPVQIPQETKQEDVINEIPKEIEIIEETPKKELTEKPLQSIEEVKKTAEEFPEESSELVTSLEQKESRSGGFFWGVFITVLFFVVIKLIRSIPEEKATICPHCKTAFDKDDKFCPKCGKKRKKK